MILINVKSIRIYKLVSRINIKENVGLDIILINN
jgi:hypothetical protein